jgi:hypothetical protein
MRHLAGGLIGALAAGVIVTAWHAHSAGEQASWPAPPASTAVLRPVVTTPAEFVPTPQPALASLPVQESASPLSVRCEPGQRAVVRQVPSASGTATEAACVSDQPYVNGGYAPAVLESQPRVVPAAYTVAAPEPSPRIVYRDRPVRRAAPSRSWKKTALVIGGSTGAGAGIGAMAGGKKGALIGAAIGGGAATVYEAIKRN